MTIPRRLIFCDSGTASEFGFAGHKTACWLHVDESDTNKAPMLAVLLARAGAVHFAVSGIEASYLHDEIDDALIAAGFEVATTWHEEPVTEVAWDFLNVDFVAGEVTLRCVVVLGRSLTAELERLTELVGYLADASRPDGCPEEPEGQKSRRAG